MLLLHFTACSLHNSFRLINNNHPFIVQFFWNCVGDIPVAFLKYLPNID